ncbi:MAG: hypothetical protein JSV79_10950 [Armatimonadota bacterium]|nr:MAG: hypothetical protein JSV79_10950 [Armatimonadota bacterium]
MTAATVEVVLAGLGAAALSALVYAAVTRWRWAVRFETARAREASRRVPPSLRRWLYGDLALSPRYHAAKLAVLVGLFAVVAALFWLTFVAGMADILSGKSGIGGEVGAAAMPQSHPGVFVLMVLLAGLSWVTSLILLWKRDAFAAYVSKILSGAWAPVAMRGRVGQPARLQRLAVVLAVGGFVEGMVFLWLALTRFR